METVTLVVTPNETSYSNVVLAAQLRRRHSHVIASGLARKQRVWIG